MIFQSYFKSNAHHPLTTLFIYKILHVSKNISSIKFPFFAEHSKKEFKFSFFAKFSPSSFLTTLFDSKSILFPTNI